MKQEPFAVRLGIPVTRLKSYELGRAPIRYQLADKVAGEFDVNQRWIATGQLPAIPYFHLADDLDYLIPPRMLFSEVYDRLLDALMLREMEQIAELHSLPLPEIGKVAWASSQAGLGASRHTRKEFLFLGIHTDISERLEGWPVDLLEEFAGSVAEYLDAFEKRHEKRIDAYLAELQATPLADYQADGIRAYVSQKLGVPQEKLPTRAAADSKPQERENIFAGTTARRIVPTYPIWTTKPAEMESSISERIKLKREESGLSQTSAAKKWGFSLGAVRDWEQGRKEPRGLYREQLEKILSEG